MTSFVKLVRQLGGVHPSHLEVVSLHLVIILIVSKVVEDVLQWLLNGITADVNMPYVAIQSLRICYGLESVFHALLVDI